MACHQIQPQDVRARYQLTRMENPKTATTVQTFNRRLQGFERATQHEVLELLVQLKAVALWKPLKRQGLSNNRCRKRDEKTKGPVA